MTEIADSATDDEAPRPDLPPVPWWGPVAAAAFVGLVVLGYIATAVAPRWAITNPEGLLALHARVRHLLLALANDITWWTYAGIAGARLALAFVVCHVIGRAYGDRVKYWFGRYLGVDRQSMTGLERGFDRADWIIVPFFVGSNIVAAITGIRGMTALRLGVLLTIGLVVRLVFWWAIAEIFEPQLDTVLDWIGRYQRPLLIVSGIAVVVGIAINMRRGRNFQL